MKNYRLLTEYTGPADYVTKAIEFIRKYTENKKVFCALSGGIDSSTTYLLLQESDAHVLPVFIDHGLMRKIEGVEEKEHIKKRFPEIKIVDVQDKFLPKIYGVSDAEEKRKMFKKLYSETFNKIIKEENCDLLADGTILPDLEESFGVKKDKLKEVMNFEEEQKLREENLEKGFVKSQHNVEITYDVEGTIQPVASLTKDQVRDILEYFEMSDDLVYRKAFPGPALAARIVGEITEENLAFEKNVHDIVETAIDSYYENEYGRSMIINDENQQEPFQAFAATAINISEQKVTGLMDGKRVYLQPKISSRNWNFEKLQKEASKLKDYSRLLFPLITRTSGLYDVLIRSVNSIDARTASVTDLPYTLLEEIAENIIKIPDAKNIYFDITPKPPGTIEYV
ncbi:MAG: hypothetical protein U9O98_09700 [Asgard group archaeon]|nr:hypothetical protein [Asgard group archaeon]